jgi:hypothetical protein
LSPATLETPESLRALRVRVAFAIARLQVLGFRIVFAAQLVVTARLLSLRFGITLHVAIRFTFSFDECSLFGSIEVPTIAFALVLQAPVHFNGVALLIRGTLLPARGDIQYPF